MNFLRILFPTWKFFNRLGTVPELLYRMNGQVEWTPAFVKPNRTFFNLFLNPEGNLYLAKQSLVERLLYDSQRTKNLEKEISFQLLKNHIEHLVKERSGKSYEILVRVKSVEIDHPVIVDAIQTSKYEVV